MGDKLQLIVQFSFAVGLDEVSNPCDDAYPGGVAGLDPSWNWVCSCGCCLPIAAARLLAIAAATALLAARAFRGRPPFGLRFLFTPPRSAIVSAGLLAEKSFFLVMTRGVALFTCKTNSYLNWGVIQFFELIKLINWRYYKEELRHSEQEFVRFYSNPENLFYSILFHILSLPYFFEIIIITILFWRWNSLLIIYFKNIQQNLILEEHQKGQLGIFMFLDHEC